MLISPQFSSGWMTVNPLHGLDGGERQSTGEHLVEGDAEGVEIAAGRRTAHAASSSSFNWYSCVRRSRLETGRVVSGRNNDQNSEPPLAVIASRPGARRSRIARSTMGSIARSGTWPHSTRDKAAQDEGPMAGAYGPIPWSVLCRLSADTARIA